MLRPTTYLTKRYRNPQGWTLEAYDAPFTDDGAYIRAVVVDEVLPAAQAVARLVVVTPGVTSTSQVYLRFEIL